MVIRQFFVQVAGRRQVRRMCCAFSALALVLAGCSDRTADAYVEAQTAQALLNQGDIAGARLAIGRALELREDRADILLLSARIALAARDVWSAYESCRMALALDPHQPDGLMCTAQLGLTLGDTTRSRDAVDKLLESNPANSDALLILGIHALNRKDYAEAGRIGDRILASAPEDRRGIVLKARALSLTDRRAEALAMLREAAERLGNDEMIATASLENARDAGDVGIMLEQMALLRQARPTSIDLAIDEANIRYKSGDVEGARAVGAEILDRFGANAEAMLRLARLWSEYDEDPLSSLTQQQVAASGTANAQVFAARHYLASGDPQTAGALVAGSQDVRAAAVAARVAVAMKDAGAIALAARILGHDETSCDALIAAAQWNLEAGKPTEAIKPAQLAAAECGDISDGYVLAARAYLAQQRPAGARRIFREGVTAHPDDLALARAYVRWLLAEGNNDAAKSVASRLKERTPARVSSWRLLAEACQASGDSGCVAEARQGEQGARRNFAIDLPPGARVRNPLLGQEWR